MPETIRTTPHYPQQTDAAEELKRTVAAVHAEAAAALLQALPCPTEQKLAILDRLSGTEP